MPAAREFRRCAQCAKLLDRVRHMFNVEKEGNRKSTAFLAALRETRNVQGAPPGSAYNLPACGACYWNQWLPGCLPEEYMQGKVGTRRHTRRCLPCAFPNVI